MAGLEQRTEKSDGLEAGAANWRPGPGLLTSAASGGGGGKGRWGGKPRGREGKRGLGWDRKPIRGNGGLQEQKIIF